MYLFYKVDAMIFCPGCSCKFNLRFIPYFLFPSSSCLFCSFQFAVRFSPPLLLVSCSRITKKHTCELFCLKFVRKRTWLKIANKYFVKCIPKLWWLHHQNPRQGVAFWGTRQLPALLLWSGLLPWFLTQQLWNTNNIQANSVSVTFPLKRYNFSVVFIFNAT